MIPLGVLGSARVASPDLTVFAHWPMNEGSGPVATDSVSGVTAMLPPSSRSRWVEGLDGTAVQVDQNSVLVSAATSWPTHTCSQVVVEFRMRLDAGGSDAMVLMHSVGNTDVLGFWVTPSAVKVWCYMGGGSPVGNTQIPLTTALGSWHQWRITATPATGLELRRDDVLIVHHAASREYIGRSASASGIAYIAGSIWGKPGLTVDDWKLLGRKK